MERPEGHPHGPADLYTWPSRRIRLVGDAGGVTGVLLANGDPLSVQNRHTLEPMTAWRRSPAQEKKLGRSPVYMPREHAVDRVFWRGLEALLPQVRTSAQREEAAATLPPATFSWLAAVRRDDLVPAGYVVRARAVGIVYGNNNSVVDELIDDELSLAVAVLQSEHQAVGRKAVDGVDAAVAAVDALGRLARNLHAAAGIDGEGAGERARELGFAALDSPFRRWMAGLGADSDLVEAETAWHQQVRRIVRTLADELIEQSGTAAWVGREVNKHHLDAALADLFFTGALKKAVPRAYPAEELAPTAQPQETA